MMGDLDWFGTIFGAVPEGDIVTWNRHVAKAMIRAGLAVVLIEPDGKKPLCTLSARDRKAADVAAEDAAKELGNPNWGRARHTCGVHHALTEEKQLNHAMVKRHLESGCNLAVSLAHNTRKVILIDLDTDAERRGFLSDCEGVDEDTPLTVTSPGVYDKAAEVWKHKDGGHIWFDVPDGVELPERPGKASWCSCHGFDTSERVEQADGTVKYRTCPKAWAAYWGSGYVLVPPSVRAEGPYRLTGSALPAPAWLTTLLGQADRGPSPDNPAEALNVDEFDSINTWASATTWSDILTGDGFTPDDVDNSCGCPTWTRPGGTHEKSATAHEVGCIRYDTSTGHAPIHFWSDALRVGGRDTVSKLTYVAGTRYHGDTKAAMDDLGIKRGNGGGFDWPELDDLGPVPERAGVPAGKAKAPRDGAPRKEGDAPRPIGDNPRAPVGEDIDAFWAARDALANIHTYAQAQYVSPWAMLGSVLSYVIALTPPRVKVMTYTIGSLNMYVGLVGESGAGKDTARDAARDWLGENADDDHLLQREIGTGQGIVSAYVQRVPDPDNDRGMISQQTRESVMVTVSEIDQITAHSRQQASTLVPTLRSAWMSQLLGGLYKDTSKDMSVAQHTYRLCMVVGIQPGHARALIEDTSGGLPQRFLWMPAIDPTLPEDEEDDPDLPEPFIWKAPVKLRGPDDPFTLPEPGEDAPVQQDAIITMCERAVKEIRAERRARARGEGICDELAVHDTLGRVKVAAALALLDERTEVTEEDWDLSAVVMRVSTSVRGQVVRGLKREIEAQQEVERRLIVESAVEVEKAKLSTAVDRVKARVFQVLTKGGADYTPKGVIRKSLSASARAYLEDAIAELRNEGRIEQQDDDTTTRYRVVTTTR